MILAAMSARRDFHRERNEQRHRKQSSDPPDPVHLVAHPRFLS
jgi:hypothetical protein